MLSLIVLLPEAEPVGDYGCGPGCERCDPPHDSILDFKGRVLAGFGAVQISRWRCLGLGWLGVHANMPIVMHPEHPEGEAGTTATSAKGIPWIPKPIAATVIVAVSGAGIA